MLASGNPEILNTGSNVSNYRFFGVVTLLVVLAAGTVCKEATVGPVLSGNIEGAVFDFETNKALERVSVTTTPPTAAIVTDKDGRFVIEDVEAGNYTIRATHPGYASSSVTVSVRENKTTTATLFLEKQDPNSAAAMSVEIVPWKSRSSNDSAFVNVEHRLRNVGGVLIPAYEVYFKIDTATQTLYQEAVGEKLAKGQADIGQFEKYTGNEPATSVTVDNYWFEGQ